MSFQFAATPIIRGVSPAEDFSLSLAPRTVSSTVGGTPSPLRDANVLMLAGAVIDTVFSVNLTDSATSPGVGPAINLTPGVATFAGGASASWVANGYARVKAVHPIYGTRIATAPVSRNTSGTVTKFVSYIAGSLAADLTAPVVTALSGTTASPATTAMINRATNVRNSSLWAAGASDFTAITRESGGLYALAPLIGSHHILTASHTLPSAGTTLVWCDNAGNAYAATIRQVATVSGTDIAVCYVSDATAPEMSAYNAANPSSAPVSQALSVASPSYSSSAIIKPMALFPGATWASSAAYLALSPGVMATANALGPAAFHTTHSGALGEWDIVGGPSTYTYPTPFNSEFAISASPDPTRAPFSSLANVGGSASGDITFTAIPAASTLATNNATLGAGYPILLGTTHGSSGGNFVMPWLALFTSQIQTAMQATAQAAGDPLFATYAPAVLSLTGYSTF